MQYERPPGTNTSNIITNISSFTFTLVEVQDGANDHTNKQEIPPASSSFISTSAHLFISFWSNWSLQTRPRRAAARRPQRLRIRLSVSDTPGGLLQPHDDNLYIYLTLFSNDGTIQYEAEDETGISLTAILANLLRQLCVDIRN